jgi:hypothetical protein
MVPVVVAGVIGTSLHAERADSWLRGRGPAAARSVTINHVALSVAERERRGEGDMDE